MNSHTLMILISLPLLSAVIGWFTNFIAIRMLFRPRKPWGIGFFTLHGLLPRRQEEIAVQVSETIESELFSSSDIVKNLQALDFEKDMEEFIDKVIDERLGELLEGIPLLGSFVSAGMLSKVKVIFQEEVKTYKEQLINDVASRMEHAIDVKQVVYERISDYDMEHLENIVKRIASHELRHIEWLGAILGFVIGCIQVGIVLAIGI